MTPPFPPRIHVLLARDAPLGVVIRRGPSKQVCTLLWDRSTDEFQMGQWLKGRIYARRSDLSPDGSRLIYFALNGKVEGETGGSWTAISLAPYLKAVALYAKGDGWNGGGLFTSSQSYWLNDGPRHADHQLLRDRSGLRRDLGHRPAGSFGAECLSVYYPRLLRDGWTLVERRKLGKNKDLDIFEKPAALGWTLRKLAHAEIGAPVGKGCYWDEHELIHQAHDRRESFPDWEWAEVDGSRVVWAEHGKLFAATPGLDELEGRVMLRDFESMTFEQIQAPY